MKCKFGIIIVGLLALNVLAGCKKEEPVSSASPAKYGVVNVEEVLKVHKDWKRLEQLDKHLESLKTDMGESGSSLESLGAKQADRMKKAQQQAEAELKAQLASVKASLDAHRADVARKMAQEAALARARMQKLSQGQSVRPVKNRVELGRDLIALRDRQIAAKRLELQKAAKERMESLRARLDSELSAYERQVASENQQQRINIQLKMQLEISEDEKKKLSDEIATITEEESRLKEKKRDENNSLIDKKGAEELAAVERDVAAYRSKVDADIKSQLGLSSSSSDYSKAEIQKKSEQIVSDFNRKQKELESSLHGASASSEAALAQKQLQLQQRLSDLRKGMIKEMTQSREKLMKSDMERMKKLQEQYSAQEKQRMNLYNAMLEDIKAEILKINSKENFTAVFLVYVTNVTAEDLTQKTIESLQLAQGVSEGSTGK